MIRKKAKHTLILTIIFIMLFCLTGCEESGDSGDNEITDKVMEAVSIMMFAVTASLDEGPYTEFENLGITADGKSYDFEDVSAAYDEYDNTEH